jgi:glycerophosphoryl diester phosphodiesterase
MDINKIITLPGGITMRLGDIIDSVDELKNLANSISNPRNVRYIGHRGISAIAPENTIPSYRLAGGKVWGAECDICETSDGEWILMHDTTVDRTTNGTGLVSSLTLAEIKALTVDYGNNIALYPNLKVPTLVEYLQTCKVYNLVPVIEVKTGTNDSLSLVNLIKEYNFENNCIVISFSSAALLDIREYSENIKMQFITSGTITQAYIDTALSIGNCGIDADTVTAVTVELCHSNGIEVNVWTIDTAQTAKTYIGYGVDYITTNKLIEVK